MGKIKTFLRSNETMYRTLRTIVQGLISVILVNIDLILGGFSMTPEEKSLMVAFCMAVLSPIMGALGGDEDE